MPWCVQAYDPESRGLHHSLASLPLTSIPAIRNHSHGSSAATRQVARTLISEFAFVNHLKEYHVQAAISDFANGKDGDVKWIWASDTQQPRRKDKFTNKHIAVFVDVLSHMSERQITNVFARGRPFIAYDVAPTRAAGHEDDEAFFFDEVGNYVTNVAGGARYVQKVWDFGTDVLGVPRKVGPFTAGWYYYKVSARRICDQRCVFLFTPMCRSLFKLGRAKELSRLRTGPQAKWVRIDTVRDGDTQVSIARPGSAVGVTVSASVVAMAKEEAAKKVPSSYAIVSYAKETNDVKLTGLDASLLLAYAKEQGAAVNQDAVWYPREVRAGQPHESRGSHEPLLRAIMSPVVDATLVPTSSAAMDRETIRIRISDPQRKAKAVLTHKLESTMDEFLELLVEEEQARLPADPAELVTLVADAQKRRRAHAGLEVVDGEDDRSVDAFVKAEPVTKLTAGRLIANFAPRQCYRYAAYVVIAEEILAKQDWYAFKRKGADVAQRVSELASQAENLLGTDFEKMDGHINDVPRTLELKFLLRLFPAQHHEEIARQYRATYNRVYVTKNRVYAKQELSRGSGARDTSCMNTLVNAFVNFNALRKSGLSPTAAYKALGIYGGDDGLTANLSFEHFEAAARDVGMSVKAEEWRRGEHGVNFLARVYSKDVWNGDPASCCDPIRSLGKFHLAVPNSLTTSEAVVAKALCLAVADKDSPLVGPFVQAIVANGERCNLLAKAEEVAQRDWSYHFKEGYINRFDDVLYHNTLVSLGGPNLASWDEWLATHVASETEFSRWIQQAPCLHRKVIPSGEKLTVVDNGVPVPADNVSKPVTEKPAEPPKEPASSPVQETGEARTNEPLIGPVNLTGRARARANMKAKKKLAKESSKETDKT
jgi:hypothetical protein